MKKIYSLFKLEQPVKLICWDLDGTLFDTEIMWFNMDKLVSERYGTSLSSEEINKFSEQIAAEAYKTWGYKDNAENVLNYFKEKNICQLLINKCSLTNKTMFKNESVNSAFPFNNFNGIISEESFSSDFTLEDMYKLALEKFEIKSEGKAIAICDMPLELKAAKDSGFITIWAKNKNYPFTRLELREIEKSADYYVENFLDLIK